MEVNKSVEDNQIGYYYEYEYYYDYELLPGAKEAFYVALALQWLNTVLIVSLNTAVIITIYRYKKKSRLYFLLMNMAIADLITGLLDAFVNALERSVGAEYVNYAWYGGDFLCRLQRTLSSASMCASNFILAATSIDRAFVIAKPMMNFKRGYTLQKILIMICWLLSLALSSPLFAAHLKVTYDPPYIEGTQMVPLCYTLLDHDQWKIMFYLKFIFYFLIPLIVIIISYTILIFAIYKRARSPPNCIRGVENMKLSLVFNKGLPSTKARSIKLTFGIVLSFVAAWTPFMVMLYMIVFQGFHNPLVMPFITTYYWNCSVNPIIFFVFHRRTASRSPQSVSSSETVMSRVSTSARNTPERILRETETMLQKQKRNNRA